MICLLVCWGEGQRRLYGPWEGQPDGSHQDQIVAFCRQWESVNGPAEELTLFILLPPDVMEL